MKTEREQLVMGFLGSLGPKFESVRSQLLSSTKLPSLTCTFARVLRVSRETSTSGVDHNESALKSALLTSVTSDSQPPPYSSGRGRFTSHGHGFSSSGQGSIVNVRKKKKGKSACSVRPMLSLPGVWSCLTFFSTYSRQLKSG